jgi:ABC-type multidrug transport system ATPase subunit
LIIDFIISKMHNVEASALSFRNISYSVKVSRFFQKTRTCKVSGKRDKLFRKVEPDSEKAILNNVNGVFGKGELIAIMGPSGMLTCTNPSNQFKGAGKTSLLEILADRCKPSNSEARIMSNG